MHLRIPIIRGSVLSVNFQKHIKPTVILCVLLLSAALGSRSSIRIATVLSAGLVGGLFCIIFYRRMEFGILAILPVTFLLPFMIGTGTAVQINSTILILVVLFTLWIVKMLVFQKNVRLLDTPLNLPVLIFISSVTISLVIGNFILMPGRVPASLPAQIGGWLMFTFSAGSILLVSNHVHNVRWLKIWLWVFLLLGAIYLVVCWRYGIHGANERFFREGISGAVFWTLLIAIGTGQALFNKDLNWSFRLMAGSIAIAGLAFGWIRGKEWLAGWLPPLIAVWIMLWLYSWKLGLFLTIAGIVIILPFYSDLHAKVNSEEQQWSTYSRFLTWPIMFELVKINPLFGLGPANYHHYTSLYSLYGYHLNFNSHNNYWDLAAQIGLLGLGTFFWMVFAIIRLGLSVMHNARDSFTRTYAIIALGSFVASLASGMMADWFMPFLYNIGFPGFRTSIMLWLLVGGLIPLYRLQFLQYQE
jgi:O-antigen ligase